MSERQVNGVVTKITAKSVLIIAGVASGPFLKSASIDMTVTDAARTMVIYFASPEYRAPLSPAAAIMPDHSSLGQFASLNMPKSSPVPISVKTNIVPKKKLAEPYTIMATVAIAIMSPLAIRVTERSALLPYNLRCDLAVPALSRLV